MNVCIISPHLLMKTTNKLSLAGKKINAFSLYIMMVYGNQGTLICLTISNNTLNFFSFPPRQTEMNSSKKILSNGV